MKQNQAVIAFTKQVLGSSFQPSVDVTTYITDEQRQEITSLVTAGLQAGEIELKERSKGKLADPKALKSYVSGLVTNWFQKSKELNGGVKHAIKNPGSRTNEQIKQAIALRKQLVESGADEARISEVDVFIQSATVALESSKPVKAPRVKKVKGIDLSTLPEMFRDLAM